MADFVAAIDQGTTSTRCMIFNHAGEEVGRHQLEHQQVMPRAGWVEHNPVEIWERTSAVLQTVLNSTGLGAGGPGGARPDQPARDHRGVEPPDRPALLQRHRLAGHPHRPPGHRPRPGRPRRRHPAPGRAAAGDLLLGRQDPVDPRERRGRPRGGRAGRRAVRHHRLVAAVAPHRRRARRRPRHRRHQRQPHHADGPRDPRLGRRAALVLRDPPADAAADPPLLRARPVRRHPRGRSGRWRGAPDRRARRPAGRDGRAGVPVRRARPRTPTAPATSCC